MTGCLSLLARLGRDNAGNTLALAAASLLPMMALIGGGVDISRAYMAKTELQSACDAGVLAGRKAWSKSGSYGDPEKAKADTMFKFNFEGEKLGISNPVYETDDNDDGQVLGTATARLPTLIMKIFDQDKVDLAVNCMAELQIGNADIMFVLDNTHSMLCTPEDQKNPCTQLTINNTTTRFYGLKEAVKDFHKTINTAVNDTRTRIRYGFVPYAMTVNVSGLLTDPLYAMPSSYIADSQLYQTRVANFDTAVYVQQPVETKNEDEWYKVSGVLQKISSTQCTDYGKNKYPSTSGVNPVTVTPAPPGSKTVTTYSYGGRGTETTTNKSCYRKVKTETTKYNTEYSFTRWIYQQKSLDTSRFKTRASTTYVTGLTKDSRTTTRGSWDMLDLAKKASDGTASNITTSSMTWNGCIEERQSQTPSGTIDFDPIPDSAWDLDLVMKPDEDDARTQWKPMWHAMQFSRPSTTGTNSYYFKAADGKYYANQNFTGNAQSLPGTPAVNCPAPMALLDEKYATLSVDKTAIPAPLTTFLSSLVPAMYTYHDIGMIWGGRLLDPEGLFASNVNKDSDKINVSKHLIFMTDGQLQPEEADYSAYGIENYDHRIAPAGSEGTIYNRHMARFEAMCDAIKAQGTTIWVVSFASTMTTQLQNCASSGRSYYSSNTTALKNTFKFIAAQVADLRLGA